MRWLLPAMTAGCLVCLTSVTACHAPPVAAVQKALGAVKLANGQIRLPPESLPYVHVAIAAPASGHIPLRAPARVAFRDGAVSRLGVPVPARVSAVHVALGEEVTRGTALVTLASAEAAATRANVERGRLEVKAAQQLMKRQQDMVKAGVGIEMERFTAEMRLAEARSELRKALEEANLLGTDSDVTVTIRAPMDGKVLALRATVGASVEPSGEPVVEMGNPRLLWVVAEVFEQDLQAVRAGATVSVEISSIDGPLTGRVEAISGHVDPNARRVPVFISLDAGDVARLRPGMYAAVRIETDIVHGVPVPSTAVLVKEGGVNVVYVQVADAFEPRVVTVGRSFEGQVEILHGLVAGEKVVVGGALLLDGSSEQRL
jgi:cobalt-zinc-cadmium efflux system membrane fusion protein